MKTFIKITAMICVLALLAGCGLIGESDKATKKKEAENAVVMVNGEALSVERFNYYFYNEQDNMLQSAGAANSTDIAADFWEQKTDGKTNLDIAKDAALAAMIDDFLKYQKAVDEGIKITADEQAMIDSNIGQIKQNPETLAQLEMIQIDADTYEQLVIESLYIRKLISKYLDDGKIEVDRDLVVKDLEADYVKAQHILFMTTDSNTGAALSADEIAKKRALAEDVLKKVRSGANFDELMNEYCEDPGVAGAPDGYVFATGQMVKEFEDAAFSLGINQISDIVETSYGYHIIKRVPFNLDGEQEKECMREYEINHAASKLDDYVKEWKAEAKIEKNDKIYKKIKPTIENNDK